MCNTAVALMLHSDLSLISSFDINCLSNGYEGYNTMFKKLHADSLGPKAVYFLVWLEQVQLINYLR